MPTDPGILDPGNKAELLLQLIRITHDALTRDFDQRKEEFNSWFAIIIFALAIWIMFHPRLNRLRFYRCVSECIETAIGTVIEFMADSCRFLGKKILQFIPVIVFILAVAAVFSGPLAAAVLSVVAIFFAMCGAFYRHIKERSCYAS